MAIELTLVMTLPVLWVTAHAMLHARAISKR
jgi:hypothetical protein